MTVTGPVDVARLGTTYCHEHLFIDMARAEGVWGYDGLLDDVDVACEEVERFAAAGGRTIVDVTTIDLGRSPHGLRAVAEATGVHVIMGTGYYRWPYYPPDIDTSTTRDIAARLIDEIDHGVDGTGVRPGIIGEIGSHRGWVSALEERVFRAAAVAQRERGLPIMTHTPPGAAAVHVDLLIDAGADPRRVAIGHADGSLDRELHQYALDAGAFLSFDLVGTNHYPDERRARCLAELVEDGHGAQLLLSMDVCNRQRLTAWGGPGLAYLLDDFIPMLRRAGVADDDIAAMTIHNPARYLAIDR